MKCVSKPERGILKYFDVQVTFSVILGPLLASA